MVQIRYIYTKIFFRFGDNAVSQTSVHFPLGGYCVSISLRDVEQIFCGGVEFACKYHHGLFTELDISAHLLPLFKGSDRGCVGELFSQEHTLGEVCEFPERSDLPQHFVPVFRTGEPWNKLSVELFDIIVF